MEVFNVLQRIVPLRQNSSMPFPELIHTKHKITSVHLARPAELEIFIPAGLIGNERLNLLLLNDGQDVEGLGLAETLVSLYGKNQIEALVVVAIQASAARLQEYGVAGKPDFMGRGAQAQGYTDFIVQELIPFVEANVNMPIKGKRAFAGFSLGGLSAFDIAWNNDTHFDAVGVFSGSFWWRSKDLKDHYTDRDRIMHQRIEESKGKPELEFWLMTGTEDELADRNKNFIIDSIDDTVDLIKELLKKGYDRAADIAYYEMVGGKHELETWAKVLPAFLCWAFGTKRFL